MTADYIPTPTDAGSDRRPPFLVKPEDSIIRCLEQDQFDNLSSDELAEIFSQKNIVVPKDQQKETREMDWNPEAFSLVGGMDSIVKCQGKDVVSDRCVLTFRIYGRSSPR